jgi:hypothetical protein
VALVNGDGPNRANVDSRYDVSGRAVVRPLSRATLSGMKWAQIGASARGGSRDSTAVGYDLPSLTTQGGYPFWRPTYKDSLGRTLHVIPSKTQWAVGADAYVPIGDFDVTGELIYMSDDTREAVDGLQLSGFNERVGRLKGFGWYGQVSYWPIGDHDIVGYPSYGKPIHVDLSKPQRQPTHGLQLVAKVEQLHLTYRSSSRGGAPDPKTPDGDIDVNSVELGINYHATKHVRVGVNYALYTFPDSAPTSASSAGGPVQSSSQRALAPGQLLARGVDDAARDSGHTLNEVQVRFGVQF